MAARVPALLVLVVCLGCGKPTPPPAAAATAPPPPVLDQEPAPDLSPVATPDDLVLIGRLGRPRVLFETLASWSGTPVRLTDMLPSDARELANVVAFDAPIELAGVLNRRSQDKSAPPVVAVSVGLNSLSSAVDLAKSQGVNVTRVAAGVYRLPVGDELACAIAASVGSAPARLVCAGDWQDVEDLLPYATRGLPVLDLGANDLQVRVDAGPLKRRYAQEIGSIRPLAGFFLRNAQTDNRRLDRALTDVVYGLADELRSMANELETFEINARLDEPKKVLELGYRMAMKGDQSLLGQLVRGLGRASSPAPASFWQLPSEGDMGAYRVASDEKRVMQVIAPLGELLDAYLEKQKLAAPFRKHARAALEAYVPAMSSAMASVNGQPPGGSKTSGVARSILPSGWAIGVVQAKADRLNLFFSELSQLFQGRELGKFLKQVDIEPKFLPKVRRATVKIDGFAARANVYAFEFGPELVELIERRLNPDDAPASTRKSEPKKRRATGIVIVVVPDGEETFLAYGNDQKEVIQRLEALRRGKEPSLADVAPLEPLKRERAAGAGYWTLAGFLRSWGSFAERRGIDVEDWLTRMQNHGRSLWLVDTRVTEQGQSLALSATVRIPQAAFQDGGSVALDVVQQFAAARTEVHDLEGPTGVVGPAPAQR